MDIHVEAPNHPNYAQLDQHYRDTLLARYEPFEFIKTVEVKVKKEKDTSIVKLVIDMERDPIAFVEASDMSEDKAFKEAMQKMDKVVRRYKSKHYHGI